MYLAYIDESGSTGDVTKGGSKSYTLGCVLVPASQWATARDALVRYRLHLKAQFGLPVDAEVKANHLIQNVGPFRHLTLGERARYEIYRGLLRLCPKLHLKVFAIVIRKHLLTSSDPHDLAWTLLLQRLARLTRGEDVQAVIFHDECDHLRVRDLARGAQRAGSAGLLEDPVSRRSHDSLFLQLADLVAYAAFRRVFPPPDRTVQIVPELMWDELDSSALAEESHRPDGPISGILMWP